MKRKSIVTAGLAVALVLGAAVAPAAAYLTDNDEALGQVPVGPLSTVVRIEEKVEDLSKVVTLTADEKSGPVYVRMRAYTGPDYMKKLVYAAGEGWDREPDSEGWFYYAPILNPGEPASSFGVELVDLPEGTLLLPGDKVNIVIVYEYTPVLYQEDGTPYADWNLDLKVGGEA